jgi:hypothetical protein
MQRCLFRLVLILGLAGGMLPASAEVMTADQAATTRKLYLGKCAKCHRLYEPAKYTDAQWEMWMTKMSRKAKLKSEQEAALNRYIQENFRQAPKSR